MEVYLSSNWLPLLQAKPVREYDKYWSIKCFNWTKKNHNKRAVLSLQELLLSSLYHVYIQNKHVKLFAKMV
jgi:hypothetical protein